MTLLNLLDTIRQDFRYGARVLVREPLITSVIVLTLALGIGANAAMFGVIDRLLLRGPEYVRNPERVMRVYISQKDEVMGERTHSSFGYVTYALLRDRARVFEQVAAFAARDLTIGRGTEARQVRVGKTTWDLFPLLGVQPFLGRFFDESEDHPPSGEQVVVLSYDYWVAHFQGARDVLGKQIQIGSAPSGNFYTIIGVAPNGFTGPELRRIDLWTPMSTGSQTENWATTWNSLWLDVYGRLKPGITPEQASTDITAAYRAGYTGSNVKHKEAALSVAALRFNREKKETLEITVTRWVVGVSIIVLLVACANVANLLLARATRRRREVAVRLALGISRTRLVGLLLTESLLLALLGGVLALAVAQWGGQFIRVLLLPDVEWSSAPLSGRVLFFSALATVLTGLLVGVLPAAQAARHDLSTSLKAGVREGGVTRSPVRAVLTIAQAALSVLLLVGSGLFVRSFWNARHLPLGLEPDRVLSVSISGGSLVVQAIPNESFAARVERQDRIYFDAAERIRRLPGVEAVALSVGTPFSSAFGLDLKVPGRDSIPQLPGGGPYISAVTADYFKTVGTRILRGRSFTDADRAGREPVAVVNETMARVLWPGEAIGKCLNIDEVPGCARIVGIAENARRFALKEEAAMQYYIPKGFERNIAGMAMLVRPTPEAAARLPELIRREVQRLNSTVGYIDVKTMQERLDPQVRPWRLGATMFVIFGVLALLIAGIGLYSVIAYAVAQRKLEFGIRAALGARSTELVALVLRQAVVLAVIGLAIGIALALVGGRSLAPLLFDTSPRDPAIFAGVTVTLLAVALLAGLLPAVRARRVNPADALRSE